MRDPARLYDHAHRKHREHLANELARLGSIDCARCQRPVFAERWLIPERSGHVDSCVTLRCDGECWVLWDLGHPDDGSTGGIEHRSCNRAAGGRNAYDKTLANSTATMVRREW